MISASFPRAIPCANMCQCLGYGVSAKQNLLSHINSLTPGRRGSNIISMIFKSIIQDNSLHIRCEITLRWTSHNATGDKSTLVQVMTW